MIREVEVLHCGSETTEMFGFGNMLREMFAPQLEELGIPAHKCLQSIRNITIERGWLRLRIQWGENVKIFWAQGEGIYDPNDEKQ